MCALGNAFASAREQGQLGMFVLLSLAAAGAAETIAFAGADALFEPYFGRIAPHWVFGATAVLGVASLRVLQRRRWFDSLSPDILKGLGIAAALATLLAIPVIVVDYAAGIDVAIVPPPWSLLFYPSIALVVEVLFHMVPLALLLTVLGSIPGANRSRVAWICILLVSLLEPTYQLQGLADQSVSWLDAYVWLQVGAVNVLQLCVFRRFGFAPMYSFRLVYYLFWHILWGSLRSHFAF